MDGIIKAIELLKESHRPVSMFSTVEKCKAYNDAINLAILSLEGIQEQYENETLYNQIDEIHS